MEVFFLLNYPKKRKGIRGEIVEYTDLENLQIQREQTGFESDILFEYENEEPEVVLFVLEFLEFLRGVKEGIVTYYDLHYYERQTNQKLSFYRQSLYIELSHDLAKFQHEEERAESKETI